MTIRPVREILRSSTFMNVIATVGGGARVKAMRRLVIRIGASFYRPGTPQPGALRCAPR